MKRCEICEFHNDCVFAEGTKFCDDCANAGVCFARGVSCKAGYDIECNNGFAKESI